MRNYSPDFAGLEQQIEKMLSRGLGNCSDLKKVEGGLFNEIYLWVTMAGKGKDAGYECPFYLKQYQNSNRSTVFAPPAIDKQIRCSLAFKVHRFFNAINDDLPITTRIHCMAQYDLLIIQGVQNPKPLIEYLASGEILWEPLTLLMKGIARVHVMGAKEELLKSDLKANTVFRDYKLKLQYEDLSSGLDFSDALKREITALAEKYKTQQFTVLHGDLNSRNVIFNGEDTSFGVIDFEQSHVGHPVYDLAYILSELYMACLYHGMDAAPIETLLIRAYTTSNPGFEVENSLNEFKKHLGVQILYRIYGPSKDAWTFYMEDAEKKMKIIEWAKSLIIQTEQSTLDAYI